MYDIGEVDYDPSMSGLDEGTHQGTGCAEWSGSRGQMTETYRPRRRILLPTFLSLSMFPRLDDRRNRNDVLTSVPQSTESVGSRAARATGPSSVPGPRYRAADQRTTRAAAA